MKGDKVSIWLEDRKTKQQWESGELSEAEVVGSDDVIPQAKLTHYVQCFHNCLAAETMNNGVSDFQRNLVGHPNGVLKLTFTLKLRVFTSEWTPSYTFELKPVALEAVDVLNSKLHDQEEEIEMLRSALNDREEVGVLCSEFAEFKKGTSCGSTWRS